MNINFYKRGCEYGGLDTDQLFCKWNGNLEPFPEKFIYTIQFKVFWKDRNPDLLIDWAKEHMKGDYILENQVFTSDIYSQYLTLESDEDFMLCKLRWS